VKAVLPHCCFVNSQPTGRRLNFQQWCSCPFHRHNELTLSGVWGDFQAVQVDLFHSLRYNKNDIR